MVSILGVVSPFAGTSLSATGGQQAQWSARVELVCWQPLDGDPVARRLTLRSTARPRDEASGLIAGFTGYDVVSCEHRDGVLLRRPELAVPPPRLAAMLEQLRRPRTVGHRLGEFTYTLESDAFDGESDIDGPVQVRLNTAEAATACRMLDELADALASGRLTRRNLADRAVTELFDLANDEWLDEDERVTAAEFRRRMVLSEITVDDGGDFEAYHDDGELFAGHVILVQGTLAEGPSEATLAG
ncbi:DUF2262 domain-containing protein [Stackebrandtia nassauensis]|uniref:DUF2262 domain-containing protein n=1 Tax=Stackebrandtia nassauensis (strain DSM 44728 / CIP 108903 / NRRL B-16338 / NBRC 102104 / LLR-40K-21) TaxID=446470 RepID=D3Q2N0_STANL|nr:DUF2262 domain-containing protein [Stackebrandtia nassauensis]ADD45781.1 conserved hypothetical protein [Stackebrandtia nassauensis DSM 44728]